MAFYRSKVGSRTNSMGPEDVIVEDPEFQKKRVRKKSSQVSNKMTL